MFVRGCRAAGRGLSNVQRTLGLGRRKPRLNLGWQQGHPAAHSAMAAGGGWVGSLGLLLASVEALSGSGVGLSCRARQPSRHCSKNDKSPNFRRGFVWASVEGAGQCSCTLPCRLGLVAFTAQSFDACDPAEHLLAVRGDVLGAGGCQSTYRDFVIRLNLIPSE